MKKIAFIVIGLLVVLIAGLLILPSLIPSSVYKEKIETQLTQELDRKVTVVGDVKLSVFPMIRAKAGRVEISNPEGFETEFFATMDGLNAGVKLFPLFSKRVEITSFSLKNPTINLEKNRAGEMNWVMGAPKPDAAPVESEGPFMRDGRYANIDPNIGKFILENGSISYSDKVENVSHTLKDVNLAFSLLTLADPLKLEGDFIYNDVPVDLKVALESVRGFLDGKNAPLIFELKTDFVTLDVDGAFLPSENLDFKVNANGVVKDAAKLVALIPQEIPNAELVSSGKFSGTFASQNGIFSAQKADIDVKGDGLSASFVGNATLKDTPVLDGKVAFSTTKPAALAKTFAPDVKGTALLTAVDVRADLTAQDKGFAASNIVADIKGQDLSASFKGQGNYADILTSTGQVEFSAGNIPELVKALDLDLAQAAALRAVKGKGVVTVKDKAVSMRDLVVDLTDGILTANYQGNAAYNEVASFDGTFSGALSSVSEFAKVTNTEIPYSDAVGRVKVDGTVKGAGPNIDLSNLNATLTEGQLTGSYTGNVSVKDGIRLNGAMTANIASLRALATTAGTELPPSTDAGKIFENFAVKGTVNGTPETIKFQNAELTLDAITGTGDFNVDMTGAKPFATGTLDLAALDLRPYMRAYSAQKPEGAIVPWSETPLNLTPLRAVDANLALNTPSIKMDRLSLGETKATLVVKDGVMTADMPSAKLYGGAGYVKTILDGSGANPKVSFDAGLKSLETKGFLKAIAGFTNASGEGRSIVNISASGESQAAIMRSLTGEGDFSIKNGEISGVDLTQLLSGLETALSSRSLPTGIGSSYATKFQDLGGAFTVKDGVVSIGDFNLQALGVSALGGGTIDMGNQKIDFKLRPKLTGKPEGALASYGIPIKVTGGFGQVNVGLDTDFLGKIVAEKARAEAQSLITDKVGGQAGSILGSIIGGQSTTGSPEAGTSPGTKTPSVESAVGGILGGLIKKEPAAVPAPTPAEDGTATDTEAKPEVQKEEPKVEEQILNLFKKKKKAEE